MKGAPVALAALLAACASPPAVHHVGVMREVMREGRTEARARLADHLTRGTVGVGALTGLYGELTIDDGTAWVAIDTPAAVAAPAEATATLLTAATVARWTEVPLAATADLDALELAIERAAGGAPPDGEVLPFTVDGRGAVRMHVARGGCPHAPGLPPELAPAWFEAEDVPLRLVGFLVRGREGVMTHHGTSLHVHAFATGTNGHRSMGHVEQVALAPGAMLRLPAGSR